MAPRPKTVAHLTACICGDKSCIIPRGYCHCQCGQKTTIPTINNYSIGRYAGVPVAYVSGHNTQIRPELIDARPFRIDGRYCRLIELRQKPGKIPYHTIVLESEYEEMMQWAWFPRIKEKMVYAIRTNPNGAAVTMHDQLLNPRKGKTADHINRVGLDNRRTNLREATPRQQVANRGKCSHGVLPYKGLRHNKSGSYTAALKYDGVVYYFGTYWDIVEAARAYDRGAISFYGEFAGTNFPLSDYGL